MWYIISPHTAATTSFLNCLHLYFLIHSRHSRTSCCWPVTPVHVTSVPLTSFFQLQSTHKCWCVSLSNPSHSMCILHWDIHPCHSIFVSSLLWVAICFGFITLLHIKYATCSPVRLTFGAIQLLPTEKAPYDGSKYLSFKYHTAMSSLIAFNFFQYQLKSNRGACVHTPYIRLSLYKELIPNTFFFEANCHNNFPTEATFQHSLLLMLSTHIYRCHIPLFSWASPLIVSTFLIHLVDFLRHIHGLNHSYWVQMNP